MLGALHPVPPTPPSCAWACTPFNSGLHPIFSNTTNKKFLQSIHHTNIINAHTIACESLQNLGLALSRTINTSYHLSLSVH